MKNWITAVLFIVLFILLGFFIGKSCSADESLTSINNALRESWNTDKQILKQIEAINDSLLLIDKERIENKTYNKYEITKMDSLIRIDSAWVNAIIRARIERLYRLPEFLNVTSDTAGIKPNPPGTVSW